MLRLLWADCAYVVAAANRLCLCWSCCEQTVPMLWLLRTDCAYVVAAAWAPCLGSLTQTRHVCNAVCSCSPNWFRIHVSLKVVGNVSQSIKDWLLMFVSILYPGRLGGAEHYGVDRVQGRFLACERLAVSGRRKVLISVKIFLPPRV